MNPLKHFAEVCEIFDKELFRDTFHNGMPDYWEEMPEFNMEDEIAYAKLYIEIDSPDEVQEVLDLIKYQENWNGINFIWKPGHTNFRTIWLPPKDKSRNKNLRYMHRINAEANPDLYEIVSLEEIQP